MRWQLTYGSAFVVARSHWEYFYNTFAFGYSIGCHFIESVDGACNGNFLGIGEGGRYSRRRAYAFVLLIVCTPLQLCIRLFIYLLCRHAWIWPPTPASLSKLRSPYMGLLITNGEFTAYASPQWLDPATIHQYQPMLVKVMPSNSGSVPFANSAFWCPANQTADVQGAGLVGFNGCTFNSWDGGGSGLFALVARGNSSLMLQGCRHVQLQDGVSRAVVTGNMVQGAFTVDNRATSDPSRVQMGMNVRN
jgi:hypothetical protein